MLWTSCVYTTWDLCITKLRHANNITRQTPLKTGKPGLKMGSQLTDISDIVKPKHSLIKHKTDCNKNYIDPVKSTAQ